MFESHRYSVKNFSMQLFEAFKSSLLIWNILLYAAIVVLFLTTYRDNQALSRQIALRQSTIAEPTACNISNKSIERCPVKQVLNMDWDRFLDEILFRKQVYLDFNVSDYIPDLQVFYFTIEINVSLMIYVGLE